MMRVKNKIKLSSDNLSGNETQRHKDLKPS